MLKDGIVLSVSKLSKKFATKKAGLSGRGEESFWALKELSFDVKKGQILGIIGHNGAGKSTILKILSDVISPSSGQVEYEGSMLSILDIGTGFHPDLSGYDNIFLNASLLGMKKKKTLEKLEDIISFSGIAAHIHEPVKNYSSGMYLRLALSIALFTDNEIILLDEVISVGDMEFRHKAIEKMKAQAQEGKTCIMISHDLGSIIDLCDQCLLMDQGSLVFRGDPKTVVDRYYSTFYTQLKDQQLPVLDHHFCKILSVGINKETYHMNEPVLVTISYEVKLPFDFRFFLKVRSFHASVLTASNAFDPHPNSEVLSPGIYETTCTIPPDLFNAGSFLVDVIIGSEEDIFIEYTDACRFQILLNDWEKDKSWNSSFNLFSVRPACDWASKQIR